MKKGVDARRWQITRALNGLPTLGRPKGSRTGTKPGKRSIPQAWRDLDNECVEYAVNKLPELPDESLDEQFVSCAARRAHFHERRGDYKIIKLSGTSTKPRKRRTHEQRVRQQAKALLKEADREMILGLEPVR